MNSYSYNSSQNTLEEHLTNSIRRAKQKIYNQTSNYNQSFTTQMLASQDNFHFPKSNNEIRNRTSSMRTNNQSHNQKEGKALVGAMKALQERIVILQKQKFQLMNLNKKANQQDKRDEEIAKLAAALKQKQQQIKKLNTVNSNLNLEMIDLTEKIGQLEERISRYRPVIQQPILNNENTSNHSQVQQNLRLKIYQKNLKLVQFDQKVAELQQRNKLSHETIQKLMKQLQQQKKTNKKWIKLLEQQIKSDPKENFSLQGNKQQNKQIKEEIKSKSKVSQSKKDFSQLIKSNKQMYETIKRNNIRILQIGRQLKQSEQRYAKLKLLVLQLVDIANKVLPNNSQIKFLTVKIMKLENNHIESLRSYSHISRKSIIQRNSGSKDRKKSLKMSDLNSSQKKSNDRSVSKSAKKAKKDEILLSHSEKKRNFTKQYQIEAEQLQKQVNILKRQHRNLVAKADKGNNQDEEINKKIEETASLYNTKKQKLDDLRKQLGMPVKNIKREQTLRV